jgi:hypothetical protein
MVVMVVVVVVAVDEGGCEQGIAGNALARRAALGANLSAFLSI